MQTFIIDFEGLYDKSIKTYFIQEFSYYNLNSDDAHNHFIRIPLHVDFKKYWYQYKNINHIPNGTNSFQIIKDFINQNALFYIKGSLKKKFLSKFTKSKIINLDDMGCPKYCLLELPDVYKECSFIAHSNGHKNCALNKVCRLSIWLKKNVDKLN